MEYGSSCSEQARQNNRLVNIIGLELKSKFGIAGFDCFPRMAIAVTYINVVAEGRFRAVSLCPNSHLIAAQPLLP